MANDSGIANRNGVTPDAQTVRPYYKAVSNEEAIFKAAYRQGLALVLKGPTGCGKTRFVEAMAVGTCYGATRRCGWTVR
jgi:nitric oxide reductase NorQ protein